MAYGELYRFVFDAANGPEVTISVAKKDYTGEVYRRAVGGSAVLKRERSSYILGSSLEWAAESLAEDEFADLYTSDPTMYRVEVKFGASRVWRGFITPELYSAPWLNVPYDITLTASDNLSELKNFDFEVQGDKTVRELLLLLLGKTNQGITNITAISSLSGDGVSLLNLTVNMDAMAGSSYYDVLDGLLESLHAYIRFDAGTLSWVVQRETDVSNYSGISYITLSSLAATGQLFPVGNISMEINPARKELTVSEEIHAANVANAFSKSNMLSAKGSPIWNGNTVSLYARLTQTNSGPVSSFDAIAGVLFPDIISGRRYRLTFKARKGNGSGRGYMLPTMLCYGLNIIGIDGKTIYCDATGTFVDDYPDDDYPLSLILKSSFEAYSYTFDVPTSVNNEGFTAVKGSLAIRSNRSGSTTARNWTVLAQVTDVQLKLDDFPDGLSTHVVLDNGARSIGDEVTLQFGAAMAQARLNKIQEKKFTSAAITTAKDFNAFMAIDNALSVANPRLRLSGVVMFKTAAAWRLPEFIRTAHTSADNLDYIIEHYSFNLISGEIDISMLSLPAVALSYTELTTSNVYGQSSGGSGGSGSSLGTAGPQGPKGDKGDKGDKGEPGTDGTSATITGATAEYDMLNEDDGPKVDVKATGTAQARSFKFTFSGLKGEQGDPGTPGGKGDPGIPGESAYEIALRQGHADNLTESEWVASLKGDKGDKGNTGAAAGFATPTASAVYIAGGDPTAEVTASGPDTAKKFAFKFWIPKASEVIDTDARLRVRPKLYIARGQTEEEQDVKTIVINHPLLTSNSYEAVLMVYRRLNKKKTGVSQVGGGTLRMGRKGWFAALGDKRITDHAAFTVAGGLSSGRVRMRYDDIRDFIVKRFMEDSAHTKAELWGRNYAQWAAESNVRRGFGNAYKARKKFGIAIRYVNPSFTALVDQTKPLSPTTMELIDKKGTAVPRYIYSDVAPLTVELQNKGAAQRASMWFNVSG